jgi:hypothetical protein
MQEVDAERRIQILRGLQPSTPPPPPDTEKEKGGGRGTKDSRGDCRVRKRRRIAGEDDTDRDIRYAREDRLEIESARLKNDPVAPKQSSDAPVIDERGHINLFPAPPPSRKESATRDSRKPAEKNAEAEADAAKKKREYEDQYTMRFSNAAGFKQKLENPWYSSSRTEVVAVPEDMPGKDVWGNEDPRRREREKQRADANDPLAMMKKGVRQLREVERDRKKWEEERERDLQELKNAERELKRRHRHHRRRRSGDSEGSLEGFSLEANPDDEKGSRRKHSSRRRHHRDRSGERSSRHSHHHRHRDSQHDRHQKPKDPDKRLTDGQTSGWTNAPGKRYSAQFAAS